MCVVIIMDCYSYRVSLHIGSEIHPLLFAVCNVAACVKLRAQGTLPAKYYMSYVLTCKAVKMAFCMCVYTKLNKKCLLNVYSVLDVYRAEHVCTSRSRQSSLRSASSAF